MDKYLLKNIGTHKQIEKNYCYYINKNVLPNFYGFITQGKETVIDNKIISCINVSKNLTTEFK